MEFWGVELKGDKPVKVAPGVDEVVHLSQATLAEIKKGGEPVLLSAKVGNQKLVIGILNGDKIPQISFDLVFEKEFELSHNWKNGSVHLTGYKSLLPDEDEDGFPDFSDEDEDIELEGQQNGVAALPAANEPKPAAAAKKANKPEEESDDEDDSDSDDEDESGDESDEEVDGEDDDSEEESDEEEETPVKSAGGKKRPVPAAKVPDAKKAKLATPQKTDGKKGGAKNATPQSGKNATPAKSAGKGDKSNAKTPKSGTQVSCGPCKKTFNSPAALESHSKAKHSK